MSTSSSDVALNTCAVKSFANVHVVSLKYNINEAAVFSGGASAVKKPSNFQVRKSLSQVTRMHFFPRKKLTTFL